MSWKQIADAFTIDDIGARLLANLARGIYSHEAVLREYVQNACDAYKELPILPDYPTINIRVVSEDTITVQDNGIGMDEQRIKDCKKIAVSPKVSFHGQMTGFRGIGIWAGFQECDRLEIETTMAGVPIRYRLRIDFAEIYKHVNEDVEVLSDMRIQWDSLALGLPIHFVHTDILEFLYNTNDCYDLYNLDFFGGLINPTSTGKSRCVDAIRSLIHRQWVRSQFFILVATFNVRDKGAVEYLSFIDNVPQALAGWQNIENCCKAHKKNQSTRLKLCFPYPYSDT